MTPGVVHKETPWEPVKRPIMISQNSQNNQHDGARQEVPGLPCISLYLFFRPVDRPVNHPLNEDHGTSIFLGRFTPLISHGRSGF